MAAGVESALFDWCARCGYDLRGLRGANPAPGDDRAPVCPECGAEIAGRHWSVLRQIDLGLALVARGLPIFALAWVFALAAENWIDQTIAGMGRFRGMRPAWALLAAAALVPTLGMLLIGWVMPGSRAGSAERSRRPRAGAAIVLVFGVVLLIVLGFLGAFMLSGGVFWHRLGLWALRDQAGAFVGAAGLVAAAASAGMLSEIADRLAMRGLASMLRWVRIGAIASIAALALCAVLGAIGARALEASQQRAMQPVPMAVPPGPPPPGAIITGGPGQVMFVRNPQPAWFWMDGVQLCWALLFAWCAILVACLWTAALVLRSSLSAAPR